MRGGARKYNNTPTTVAISITFAVVAVCSGTMCSAQQNGVTPPDSTVKKRREISPVKSTSAAVASFTSSVMVAVAPQLFWNRAITTLPSPGALPMATHPP